MSQPDEAPDFEAQALACLQAATRHRVSLLAVAGRLTGCPEEGMNLFQQTCLDCHDAIQRRGFQGERYEFYLLTSLKNLHYRLSRQAQRTRPTDFQASQHGSDFDGELYEGDEQGGLTADAVPPESPLSERAQLAEQVAAEVREHCSPAERVLLRLHADGHSYQDIAELVGFSDRWRVRRVLDRVKGTLRETFDQAWRALLD